MANTLNGAVISPPPHPELTVFAVNRRALATALVLAAIVPLHRASAQAMQQSQPTAQAFDARSAAHLRDAYLADLDTVHAKIMALAEAIPEDKYAWRPEAGVRSVSEVLMHVVGEWYFYTPRSVAQNAPADFGAPRETLAKLEKTTAKQEVLAELRKSWEHCKTQVAAADPSQLTGSYKPWGIPLDYAAFSMDGDLHEHLGQLIAYARSVGVKPPWSK
jgi:uncharacterized damage-inducible protein DinB